MPIIATIGDANIIGNTVTQGNMNVLGTYSNLVGNLFVNYTASLGNLAVNRNTTFSGPVICSDNVTTNSNLFALQTNVAQISNLNRLEVLGGSNLYSNMNVFANLGVLANLFVQNCAYVNSTLNVSGASNLLSTLRVQGAANLLSTLEVGTSINTPSLTTTTLANLTSLRVVTDSNVFGNLILGGNATVYGNTNVLGSNNYFTGTVNVAGTSNINNALTVTGRVNIMSAANLFSTLNVVGESNLNSTVGIQGAINAVSTLTVAGAVNAFSTMNVLTNLGVVGSANLTTLNVATVSNLNQSLTVVGQSNLNSLVNAASLIVPGTSNLSVLGVTGNTLVGGNLIVNNTLTVNDNIVTPANLIIGSNIVSSNPGGNVLMTGNLVVQGNVYFSSGALGTIGGLTLTTLSNVYLSAPFSSDSNGNAFSVSLTPFQVKGTSAFIYVTAGGNIKFQLPGIYNLSGLFACDANIIKVAVGSSPTDTQPTTKNYFYVQNFSTTDRFNIPLVITDQSAFYYIDVYADKSASNLAPTFTSLGSNSGTFITVTPQGTFVPQALQTPSTWTNVTDSSNIFVFGSVGIGTTNPQSNLSVVGSLSVGSYSNTGVAAPANSIIVSGLVGVGTTTPTANLFVTGNIVSTTNVTSIGFANVGSLLINGTQVIDPSRNFTNVGTMNTGIITSTQVALAGFKNIVHRRPIWGVGSRVAGFRTSIPYGISEIDGASMGNLNNPLVTVSVGSGANRTYRVYCVFTLYGAASASSFKIRCYLGATPIDFTVPATTSTYYQDAYSNEQTVTNTNDGYFVVRANPSLFSGENAFNIEIDYLELQTLDNY